MATARAHVTRIGSRHGSDLPCYLALPPGDSAVPAVVLASTIRGLDADLRALADGFAARGYIAAAPDLFARSGTPDASQDARSRVAQLRAGEADMADVLVHLGNVAGFNGRAAVLGLCYGGPYAIVGPRRLGYAAGIACHGSQMLDFIDEANQLTHPVCLMWGDEDHRAPAAVLAAYRAIASRRPNVEVHVFRGIRHGYMLRHSEAFDEASHAFSMRRALEILATLCKEGPMASPSANGLRYEVERRARHAERPGFRITELQLSPSQHVPWHYHTHVQDTIYVVEGRLRIVLRDPFAETVLGRGESQTIPPRRPHSVINAGPGSATFLVLHSGDFDFVPAALA